MIQQLTTTELETSKSIIYNGVYAIGEIQLKNRYQVFCTCTKLLKLSGENSINLLLESNLN